MEKNEGDRKALDAHFGSIAISDEERQPNRQSQAGRESRDESRPLPEFPPAAHLPPAGRAGKPNIEGQYWDDED
jgi:hypothetical protein